MAKVKNNSKITLSEFRAWLSGVEEMQDDNWTPSQSQWETIRCKMDLIIGDEAPVDWQPVHYAQPRPQQVTSMGPAAAPIDVNARGGVGNGLTADIDSSDGNYKSSFE